ncbi:MAG TPA: FHA domain-containing protein [Thermoflexales bacterium]|nr:FHA domain-containing protein [Thermoflexales bacterium]HQW33974.1 FHA domain-containing protein [Thermoflexales bacterium]HQX75511.1 FHA domain-containing protein [Thermoflexales bacterium]
MSEFVLFALRLLAALLLLAFMGVLLLALLRDGRPAALAPAQPMRLVPFANPSAPSHELRSPTWVGHNPNCAIFLDDDSVSSRHARIEWKVLEQTWWVEDNLSRNGTWVNGIRVSQTALKDGDELRFGNIVFKLTCKV